MMCGEATLKSGLFGSYADPFFRSMEIFAWG